MSRALGLMSLFLGLFGCSSPPTWTSVKEMVRRDFPDVAHVTGDELQALLDAAGDDGARPVLLDVRQDEEFAVSHLPGAIRVDPGSGGSGLPADLDRDTPIVAYCSVGYRSSELVAKLRDEGFTNVKNLEGSIFEWANSGRPVYREGAAVREVHPFDESWGRLLNEELRSYGPSAP